MKTDTGSDEVNATTRKSKRERKNIPLRLVRRRRELSRKKRTRESQVA